MQKKRKGLLFSLFSAAVAVVLGYSLFLEASLPDRFTVAQGEPFTLRQSALPLSWSPVRVTQNHAAQVYGSAGNSYPVRLSLPGGVAVKTVAVDVVQRQKVVPGGQAFGIKMFTDGVMVINLGEIKTASGMRTPAQTAGIEIGDVILAVNDRKVRSNDDFGMVIAKSKGRPLTVSLLRDGTVRETTLVPARDESNGYWRAGIWVRDSSAGIGTLTFYHPETLSFGSLGHAVCDVDTGEILPLMSGEMAPLQITGCKKGTHGVPGELTGTFLAKEKWGDLKHNTPQGLYGRLTAPMEHALPPVQAAMAQEVHPGNAEIISTVDGTPRRYTVTIEKVNYSRNIAARNLQLHVTDPALLKRTGGIVQGMSGSPILQDGRLVGAVTHVFINDPTRGYGIFIEKMLEAE